MNLSKPFRFGYSVLAASLILTGCTTGLSRQSGLDAAAGGRTGSGEALAFQADQSFGRSLSRREKGELSAAELKALQFGQPGLPVKWGELLNGVSGSVVVTQPFRVGQSSCRGFSHHLVKDAKTQQAKGTACRRDGGPWKLVQ